MDGLAKSPCHARHTHCRAEAVIVLIVMPHDIDLVRTLHDIAQGVCHNACLHARMLFDRLCLAAKKLRLAADARRNLVAAATKGEIELCLCLLAQLLERLLLRERKPDGERNRQPLRVDDLAHLIEDVELLRHRTIQGLTIQQRHKLPI